MEGYNTRRHTNNPQEKVLHDKFIKEVVDNYSMLDLIIFGASNDAQTIPNDRVDERETRIAISIIQWLGSPVGQGFLNSCGFMPIDTKPNNYEG